MLHLLSKRKKAQNVPILQQARLPKLPPHLDLIKQALMPALPKAPPPRKFCRLLEVRKRREALVQPDGQQLKNEIKVRGA
jgi:hypothetical protein